MKFYVGKIVVINKRYDKQHKYIGTIVDSDYQNKRFQVQFVTFPDIDNSFDKLYDPYNASSTLDKLATTHKTFYWFEYKELKSGAVSWYNLHIDEMTKAFYEGIILQIRKEIKKLRGKKVLRLSRGICSYLETFQRSFFRIHNIEIICDFKNYKDLDYKLEQID